MQNTHMQTINQTHTHNIHTTHKTQYKTHKKTKQISTNIQSKLYQHSIIFKKKNISILKKNNSSPNIKPQRLWIDKLKSMSFTFQTQTQNSNIFPHSNISIKQTKQFFSPKLHTNQISKQTNSLLQLPRRRCFCRRAWFLNSSFWFRWISLCAKSNSTTTFKSPSYHAPPTSPSTQPIHTIPTSPFHFVQQP